MRLTKESFQNYTKTKSEPSQCVKGLWIARSMIGVSVNDINKPMFGFGTSFNLNECETKSRYELLEHLVFLPYIYTHTSASQTVSFTTDVTNIITSEWAYKTVQDFFIGKTGPTGFFSANGCAISTSIENAITHSRRELLERHLCCEIWYKRCRSIYEIDVNYDLDIISASVKINFYTTKTSDNDKFVMATLECIETGFFAFGAAVKATIDQACQHALCEVVMIFEDAIKGRTGLSSTLESKKKIMSLRDACFSKERKKYLKYLANRSTMTTGIDPDYEHISFEPLQSLFASRTFAANALEPQHFEGHEDVPMLPLF